MSVNGKLTSLKGQEFVVETSSGAAMVKLDDKTVIRGELPIKFSDIDAGMYVAPLWQSNRKELSVLRACMFSAKISGAPAKGTGRSPRRREAVSP